MLKFLRCGSHRVSGQDLKQRPGFDGIVLRMANGGPGLITTRIGSIRTPIGFPNGFVALDTGWLHFTLAVTTMAK